MPRRWQYPSWAANDADALTRPEVTTPDKWWQPFSEPVRQHAGKIAFAALIASGMTAIDTEQLTLPEVTSLDRWFQPLSEPVLVKKPLAVAARPSTWDDSDLLTQPEATSLDKWFSPLAEPPTPDPRNEAALIASSGGIFQIDTGDLDLSAEELAWVQSLSQPITIHPRKALIVDGQVLVARGSAPLDWNVGLSEPVSSKQYQYKSIFESLEPIDEEAEDITLDKWFQPHAEPLRVKPRAVEFPEPTIDSDALTRPEVTSLDKWYTPFSEFLHKDARSEAALLAGNNYEGEPSDFEPTAELLGWFVALSEFQHTTKRVDAALYPHFWIDEDLLTRPEVTSLDKWWRPLSEFLHRVKRSAAALEPASIIDSDLLTRPEETLVSKWVPQTNEPIRVKKGFLAALQEAFFIDANIAAVPPAEEITLDKWYQPHSEPVLVKPRASEFPTHTNDTEGLTLPETTSIDKWFFPLSEPVRAQPKSLAGLLAGAIYEGEPADVEPLAEFMGWYRNLDEPVLPRVLPVSSYPHTFFENEVSELDPAAERLAWYVELATPTLPKPRVAEFPAYVIDSEALTQPEVTSLDRWWQPLSEFLHRVKRSLASLEPASVIDADQLTQPEDPLLKWAQPTNEPVRLKARLLTALQTAYFPDSDLADIPPEEVITLDKWYVAFSEPIRILPRTSEFPAHTIDTDALTRPETTTLDRWYAPFSEPVLPLVLPIAHYPAEFFEQEISELDPTAEELAWFVDLALPTLPKVRVAEFPQPVIDTDALTRAETTSLDKWFVGLSEPLRVKPPLPVGAVPTLVESLEPIIILELGWNVPLSEPIFIIDPTTPLKPSFFIDPEALTLPETTTLDKWFTSLSEPVRIGDRLIVPRLPAQVGERLPDVAALPVKAFISREADQTHISKEADQTHVSLEADMTKDDKRC